jgi:LysR family transcriptional regulator, glycine cleavage system transcriptional activator
VLLASDGEIDFTQANIDLAILWGADPGEHEGVKLADGAMVLVVGNDGSAAATAIAWPGSPADEAATLSVADAGLAIDAAAHGFGKATVPMLLAKADIDAVRVRAMGDPSPVAEAYWLIAPLPQWRQKKVKMLVAALTAQNGTFLVG